MLDHESMSMIRELRAKANRAVSLTPAGPPLEPEMAEIAAGAKAQIHRVSYTVQVQSGTTWHHLAVSLKDSPKRLPSPLVIAELMQALNFYRTLPQPLEVPPLMDSKSRSAAELPLVYRDTEAPEVVNVVEPLLEQGPCRSIP